MVSSHPGAGGSAARLGNQRGQYQLGGGLGVLLERCAARLVGDGKPSGTGWDFSPPRRYRPLDPNRAPLAYEIVHCDTSLNLTTNAVVRMERFAATMGEPGCADDSAHFAVHLQIALTMLDRLRAWSRGPAAPYAAERIERVGEQLRHLVDREQVAAKRAIRRVTRRGS